MKNKTPLKMPIFKAFIVVFVFIACFLVIWKFSQILDLNNIQGEFPHENTVKMKRSKGGGYDVQIKNITGTVASSKPNEHTFYDMDITLKTDSSSVAKLLINNHAKTMNTISSTISNFSSDELTNHLERNKVKTNIKRNLARTYSTDEIGEIYIEKFFYQHRYMSVNILQK